MKSKFKVTNIKKLLSVPDRELGEQVIQDTFSEFFCSKNLDIENYLKKNSIEFTKKNQSVTYIVVNEMNEIVGYFTLAIKPIKIDITNFSNTAIKKISRVAKYDEESKSYLASAYLIAQLGKNFNDKVSIKITGKELMQLALDVIEDIQYMIGGNIIFLETKDNKKLLDFYEKENGFKRFNITENSIKSNLGERLLQLLKIL